MHVHTVELISVLYMKIAPTEENIQKKSSLAFEPPQPRMLPSVVPLHAARGVACMPGLGMEGCSAEMARNTCRGGLLQGRNINCSIFKLLGRMWFESEVVLYSFTGFGPASMFNGLVQLPHRTMESDIPVREENIKKPR